MEVLRSVTKKRTHVAPIIVSLVLLIVVLPCAKCEMNGVESMSFLNTLFDLPLQIGDFVSQAVGNIGGIFSGEEPVNTVNLISGQGFRPETHEVTTDDGYILELHRIRRGSSRHSKRSDNKSIPVVLLHGIAQSSADWVLNSPKDDALGFHLTDKGFDVWLANQRGTPYSTRHVSIDPTSAQFWDFSTHEVGVFDLPAIIDYILRHTDQDRVNFVGFSQGNAAFLILNSKRPEYNEKIGVAVFLAPAFIYYDGFYQGIVNLGAPLALNILNGMKDIMGPVAILSPFLTRSLHYIMPVVCSPTLDFFGLCLTIFKAQYGDDQGLITREKLSMIQSISPVPISLRTVIQVAQQMSLGEFTEYDFGSVRNQKLYGRPMPPKYNLTNVQAPIVILVGPADSVGSVVDAERLAKQLPNLINLEEINYPHFTHADFCYATHSGKWVHNKVVKILQIFSLRINNDNDDK